MSFESAIKRELTKYKQAWRSGRHDALIEAFILCAGNGEPLPEWLYEAVLEQLNAIYAGPSRRKRARPPAAADASKEIHMVRWRMASLFLGLRPMLANGRRKPTRADAFAKAADELRGKPARGGKDAIEKSYKLVERAIKSGNREKFGLPKEPARRKPG